MTDPVLRVENLTISYGAKHAVRDVSFDVHAGEIVALVGRSGAGKSSIISAIMDMLPASATREGTISVAGESPGVEWRNRVVSLIPQNPFSWFNPLVRVRKQIAEVTGDKARTPELLRVVGLDDVERVGASRPEALSGGMRQRVAIATAIAHNPQLLLADEPTSALDPESQAQILELLSALRADGQSILLVSHDTSVVERLADRVLHLEDGSLVDAPVASSALVADRDSSASDLVALRCADVSLSYPGRRVLANLTMEAMAGETLAIVGESGRGKSSLCHVLAGIVKPQTGSVEVKGKQLHSLSRKQRSAALRMMFQDVRGSIDERMSVRHNIALALSSVKMTDVEKRDRVLWACDVAGLDDSLLDRRPPELSGGELQRACLARAIASRPPVLLLDEPFSALDTQTRAATVQRLIAMQEEFNTCIVAVLHNAEVVKGFAHRVITLP